jgi:predicted porin
MKRKALAAAVGALFVAPAAQAQIVFGNETIGTVQIYGKLYPQFQLFNSTGATEPGTEVSTLVGTSATNPACPIGSCAGSNPSARQLIEVSNSYIGVRGERNLGSTALKAIWQLEQATNFDVGSGTF